MKVNQGIIFLLSIAALSSAHAQDDQEKKGRFFVSPDIGLMIGTVTSIEISPMVGYYLTDRLSLAAGFRYEYYKDSRSYFGFQPYKTSIYGPRAQLKFTFIENIDNILPLGMNTALFVQAENETLSLEKKYFDFPSYPDEGRFWQNYILMGGGIRQTAGRNLVLNAVILWDIDNTVSSPYVNPIIRIGFQYTFGNRKSEDY